MLVYALDGSREQVAGGLRRVVHARRGLGAREARKGERGGAKPKGAGDLLGRHCFRVCGIVFRCFKTF